MDNIEQTIDGNILTIKIDLAKSFGPSGSGKSTIVASTRGNKELAGRKGTFFSVNVYKK